MNYLPSMNTYATSCWALNQKTDLRCSSGWFGNSSPNLMFGLLQPGFERRPWHSDYVFLIKNANPTYFFQFFYENPNLIGKNYNEWLTLVVYSSSLSSIQDFIQIGGVALSMVFFWEAMFKNMENKYCFKIWFFMF